MRHISGYEEIDEVSRLVSAKLAAFLRTLRDNGFAVGLQEGQDAASLMAAGYAARPGLLRSAFKHLFSARKSDWEKFDGIFDAFWLGKRRALALDDHGFGESGQQPVAEKPAGQREQRAGSERATDQMPRPTTRRRIAPAKAAWKAPRAPTIIAEIDFRKLADPDQIEEAHAAAARLAKTMRTRLTRRDLARRRGYRLDLRRTIHGNISHGGVPITLVKRQRKEKPLRLVMLLDASGSMSMYTGVFLRFIHGVLDEFREAEAFLFHTRLAHVSDAMKEKDAGARARSALDHGAGRRRRHQDRREPADLQSLACRARDPFAHLRDDRVRRLRDRRRRAARPRDGGAGQRCRRIVWLNPMMAWQGYAPEAAGIKAALPHVDLYAPANTLKSLTALEPYLARL